MNIRDLKYFLAVFELGHFGKAAEACFVSQPALSMQLKKLEAELGVVLFERHAKNILPTEIGKEIAERAQRILQDLDALKIAAKVASDPFAGTFKLGAFPTLAPYIFPKIVKPIKNKFKKLNLFLIEEKTSKLIELLLSGNVDAALIALPIEHEFLLTQTLFFDPFFVAVAKNHKYASKNTIKDTDLQTETLLLLDEGHCLRDQALSFCHQHKLDEHVSFRATSLETLRQMVSIDMGITFMPQSAIQKTDNIAYIPFAKPYSPSRNIGLVWRKTHPCNQCILAIADLITKKLKL